MSDNEALMVVGFDPGGDEGVTGVTTCRRWERRSGIWLPNEIQGGSFKGGPEGLAQHDIVDELYALWPRPILLAIEDVRFYKAVSASVATTAHEVGALRYVGEACGAEVVLLTAADWTRWWFGKAVSNPDSRLDAELLRLYGGRDAAIGGKKCENCKGKGRRGRDQTMCPACEGKGFSTAGPLYSLWKPKSIQHARVALGVAICAYNQRIKR